MDIVLNCLPFRKCPDNQRFGPDPKLAGGIDWVSDLRVHLPDSEPEWLTFSRRRFHETMFRICLQFCTARANAETSLNLAVELRVSIRNSDSNKAGTFSRLFRKNCGSGRPCFRGWGEGGVRAVQSTSVSTGHAAGHRAQRKRCESSPRMEFT